MCAHTVNMKIPAIHFGSRYCSRLAGPEFTFKMVCRVAGVMSGWQGSRTHTHSFISETQTDENDNSGEHQSECVWLWRGLEIEMVISVYLIIIKSGATTAAEVTRTLLLMAMLSMFRRTAKPYLHKSVLFFNEDIMLSHETCRTSSLHIGAKITMFSQWTIQWSFCYPTVFVFTTPGDRVQRMIFKYLSNSRVRW